MFKKILMGLGATVVVLALGLWAFWPDTLVVKGPTLDFLLGRQVETPSDDLLETRFSVPDGFKLGVFAADVPNARTMAFTEKGDMLVASHRTGQVFLLHGDADGDGVSDGRQVLLTERNVPYGLVLHDGVLYLAESDRITRFPFDTAARTIGSGTVIYDGMPAGGNHATRTLGLGPDGMLYVTIGSSCNVCIEDHPHRAAMLRMNLDGSDARIFATGLRNTVGFDWQPGTNKLFGTDNGRDLLGDDTPHCELNNIIGGADYGWPYAYDNRVADPDYGPGNEDKVATSMPMAHGFGAHRAPLGIKFITGGGLPLQYDGAALVALHGSWNRSTLAGYKVVSLHFGKDGSIAERDFLTGFEVDEDVIGRPAEITQGPDGAIYISDDYSGTIFKVLYGDGAVGGALAQDTEPRPDPLAGLTQQARDRGTSLGALLFMANECGTCHVPEMVTGDVQVKELIGLRDRYDIDGIVALLTTPPAAMPQYELTEEGKRSLAIFLLGLDAE